MSSSALLVLDTNILVHLLRNDRVGQEVIRTHDLMNRVDRPMISIVTTGEIQAFARNLKWGSRKRALLTELLSQLVIVQLHQGEIVERYAEIHHYCQKVSKPAKKLEHNDMWIAATAGEIGAPLLTTDKDFDHLDGRFLTVVSFDAKTGETRRARDPNR